jgi:hypothetical protein
MFWWQHVVKHRLVRIISRHFEDANEKNAMTFHIVPNKKCRLWDPSHPPVIPMQIIIGTLNLQVYATRLNREMPVIFFEAADEMLTRHIAFVTALTIIAMIVNIYMLVLFRESFKNSDIATTSLGKRLSNVETLSDTKTSYEIKVFRNFLSPKECHELIEFSRPRLQIAETLDATSDHTSSYNPNVRSSKVVFVPNSEVPACQIMSIATHKLSGKDDRYQEETQVASYDSGGKFDLHCDACDSVPEVCKKFNLGRGHRIATLLVYLNSEFQGGETVFENVDPPIFVRPETGMAIFFWSSVENENAPEGAILIKESMHRGSKVLGGQKWIATKWAHTYF